jgi:DNA polymerase III epsilon subunit family exonuclease
MGKADFAIIDLETTGLSNTDDEIVEIAIILMDHQTYEITGEYQTLVKPVRKGNEAERFNFITRDMLVNAPTFDQIAPTIMTLLSGRKLVGHNILGFDLGFLNNALKKHQYSISKQACIDTLQLFREFEPYHENHKLVTIAKNHGLSTTGAHEAMFDTKMTADIFRNLFSYEKDARNHTYRFSSFTASKVDEGLDFTGWITRNKQPFIPMNVNSVAQPVSQQATANKATTINKPAPIKAPPIVKPTQYTNPNISYAEPIVQPIPDVIPSTPYATPQQPIINNTYQLHEMVYEQEISIKKPMIVTLLICLLLSVATFPIGILVSLFVLVIVSGILNAKKVHKSNQILKANNSTYLAYSKDRINIVREEIKTKQAKSNPKRIQANKTSNKSVDYVRVTKSSKYQQELNHVFGLSNYTYNNQVRSNTVNVKFSVTTSGKYKGQIVLELYYQNTKIGELSPNKSLYYYSYLNNNQIQTLKINLFFEAGTHKITGTVELPKKI